MKEEGRRKLKEKKKYAQTKRKEERKNSVMMVVVVLMTVVVCRQLMILGMRWGWISDKEISYLKLEVDSMFPPCHPRVQICKGTYIHTCAGGRLLKTETREINARVLSMAVSAI